MFSIVNNAEHRHIEVVALRASESQRKLKAAAPSEPVWLGFGIIICFIRCDCTVPCINMFNMAAKSKHSLKTQ